MRRIRIYGFVTDEIKSFMRIGSRHALDFMRVSELDYDLTITFVDNLRDDEDIWGDCASSYNSGIVIRLDSDMLLDRMIRTLSHELIHVKQILTGALYLTDDDFYWLGEKINVEYEDQPWELEAHTNEDLVYELMCEGNN